jgi:hypothetical protein
VKTIDHSRWRHGPFSLSADAINETAHSGWRSWASAQHRVLAALQIGTAFALVFVLPAFHASSAEKKDDASRPRTVANATEGSNRAETCAFASRSTTVAPFAWKTQPPTDCPFEKSRSIQGIVFTGRYANYTKCDYWYPAWAADGNLYSGCGDGEFCGHRILNAGLAKISGDDPLNLTFTYLGSLNVPDYTQQSAYPCTSLVKEGVWYLGLEEGWNSYSADTPEQVARFWGFLCTRKPGIAAGDLGYPFPPNPFWEDLSIHPLRRAREAAAKVEGGAVKPTYVGGFFREPPGANRVRNLHFVDFGRELEHSPDGRAYAVAHGSEKDKPAEWGNGDSVFLLRVQPTWNQINDPQAWEFFSGHGPDGKPVWSHRIADAKPLLTWKDKLGLAHVVYNAPLKKHLMWISPLLQSDTFIKGKGPTRRFSAEGSLLLESDGLLGPWRLVEYFKAFGPIAYCICFPSKFISADGRRAWLLCSGNYTNMQDAGNPEGTRYAAHFREVEFVKN